MEYFNDTYNKVKDGDKIVTEHRIIKGERIVTVENGGIRVEKHWFRWDYFFEVNKVIRQV
jgi:hypothetical protein